MIFCKHIYNNIKISLQIFFFIFRLIKYEFLKFEESKIKVKKIWIYKLNFDLIFYKGNFYNIIIMYTKIIQKYILV